MGVPGAFYLDTHTVHSFIDNTFAKVCVCVCVLLLSVFPVVACHCDTTTAEML